MRRRSSSRSSNSSSRTLPTELALVGRCAPHDHVAGAPCHESAQQCVFKVFCKSEHEAWWQQRLNHVPSIHPLPVCLCLDLCNVKMPTNQKQRPTARPPAVRDANSLSVASRRVACARGANCKKNNGTYEVTPPQRNYEKTNSPAHQTVLSIWFINDERVEEHLRGGLLSPARVPHIYPKATICGGGHASSAIVAAGVHVCHV